VSPSLVGKGAPELEVLDSEDSLVELVARFPPKEDNDGLGATVLDADGTEITEREVEARFVVASLRGVVSGGVAANGVGAVDGSASAHVDSVDVDAHEESA
jgi:hypothetical protein